MKLVEGGGWLVAGTKGESIPLPPTPLRPKNDAIGRSGARINPHVEDLGRDVLNHIRVLLEGLQRGPPVNPICWVSMAHAMRRPSPARFENALFSDLTLLTAQNS